MFFFFDCVLFEIEYIYYSSILQEIKHLCIIYYVLKLSNMPSLLICNNSITV